MRTSGWINLSAGLVMLDVGIVGLVGTGGELLSWVWTGIGALFVAVGLLGRRKPLPKDRSE